jgi:inner membrane protein involved in colicin E2 resistance
LSLEADALLICAGLLFAALAAIIYLTRTIDEGGIRAAP